MQLSLLSYFYDNVGKRLPILKILSLLYFEINHTNSGL